MKNNRIPHESLKPRYLDGMILYARDINEIISVLVAGVNQNKFDMDKILMGSSNSVVVYKESALEDITANEGDYATLFRYGDEESAEGDTLSLYRYDGDDWKYLRDLSFIDMATTIEDILVEINDIKENVGDNVNERIVNVENDLTQLNGRVYTVEDAVIQLEDGITHLQTGKQDKLIEGENITIENNVISVSGQVPLEEHDIIIDLQQNKADLIDGKVPLEQLPEIEKQKGLVISNTEPTDSNIEMWVKLTGEEIIL